MKKSNIILLSLLVIAFIVILVVQLKVKSSIKEIEKYSYTYQTFSTIKIKSGWTVDLKSDTITNITLNSDSTKNLISQNGDTLTLHEDKNNNRRKLVNITNPKTTTIIIEGNSTALYYPELPIDTLVLNLKEYSDIKVYSKEVEENSKRKDINNTINFLELNGSGRSRIIIQPNIRVLEGYLSDTSSLNLQGKALFKNFEKSNEARINSW